LTVGHGPREQVFEQLVGEQIVAVIGQEGLHTPVRDKLAT